MSKLSLKYIFSLGVQHSIFLLLNLTTQVNKIRAWKICNCLIPVDR